jgi:hypothetical protein
MPEPRIVLVTSEVTSARRPPTRVGDEHRCAVFSPDRLYRYVLTRIWDPTVVPAMFVGLNPSTADETKDDPTIRRCMRFARDWGYGGLLMGNLYGLRSTHPCGLYTDDDSSPVDDVDGRNDGWLTQMSGDAGIVVAAWGATTHPIPGRACRVAEAVGEMLCLGVTKDGHPRHPLYVRADMRPEPWSRS